MDTPGMKKEEIKIQVDEEDNLSLSGERQQVEETKEANFIRTERSFGKFSRYFKLPENADKGKISAEVKDGVLTITIPKLSEPVSKKVLQIPITEGPASWGLSSCLCSANPRFVSFHYGAWPYVSVELGRFVQK